MAATTVVLVDDHTLFRRSLRALLEGTEAVEVIGEADGADSVMALLEAVSPDVVLMDLNLGEGVPDGVEATKRIREKYPRLPVLMLTMYDAREILKDAARVGVNGYVLKDAEPDELLTAISAIARGGGYLSPAVAMKAMQELGNDTPPPEEVKAQSPADRYHLTPRERQLVTMLVDGRTHAEIAAALFVSTSQIKQLTSRIYEKLGAKSKSHAAAIAIAEGLAPAPRQDREPLPST